MVPRRRTRSGFWPAETGETQIRRPCPRRWRRSGHRPRHRFGRVPRLIHVRGLHHRHMTGQHLDRRAHHQGRDQRVRGRHRHHHFGAFRSVSRPLRIGDEDHLAAARHDLAHVGRRLLEPGIRRRQDDDRRVLVHELDRPGLQLSGRIPLGMDIADLLQLQRPFQCQRRHRPPAAVEDVAAFGDLEGRYP